MDAQRTAIARRCLEDSHAGAISFPEIIGLLAEASFDGYLVDYRANTTTYYEADGDSLTLENPAPATPVAMAFDAAGVAGQIRWAQGNSPGYSYEAFCRNVRAAGCAGYVVSIPGRRVLYFGRTAETHVEHFPS